MATNGYRLVIGNKNWSSWSLRPWLAMRRAGVPFEEINVRLRQADSKAAIAKYSPSGMVPLLLDGDLAELAALTDLRDEAQVTKLVDGAASFGPLGRVALTYDLMYEDSVNANYYRDHIVRLSLQQQFVPFLFTVQPELHFRKYDGITDVMGPPTRNDVIFATNASLRYNFRNNLSASVDYLFSLVSSDYRYMADGVIDDPSYARHEILLGVLWAL